MKLLDRLFAGRRSMAALVKGTSAPRFELPAMDGTRFSLTEALSRGPVMAVFFKISCPVCQYAFPFFERIYQANGSGKVAIVGVSQNEKNDTAEFLHRFGINFPVLLDDTQTFQVSNAYGLTSVPTAFWISPEGEIEISSAGWVRAEVEEMARRAAAANNTAPTPIFQPTEQIADFRAG
jgi:peroxiredoxin